MLDRNKLRYFQIPQAIISEGLLQQLTRNELSLYLHLLSEVQRTSRVSVVASLDELIRHTGISISKVGTARAGLVYYGLVVTEKNSKGQKYTLTDPKTRMILSDGASTNTYLDFNELEDDQLKAYFMTTLTDAIPTENGLSARCPFHDDSRPSLSVSLCDGGSWKCHGCNRRGALIHFETALAELSGGEQIDSKEAHKRILDTLRAAGVLDGTTGQPEAVYPYCDDLGEIEFEVLRYPGKVFKMRRPDPNRVNKYFGNLKGCRKLPYRLPEVCFARTVIVTEGEKDADNLTALHLNDDVGQLVAVTCNHGGQGNWTADHSMYLKGKRVILLGHTDDVGRKHMKAVEASLSGVAAAVTSVVLPSSYKDVSEYLEDHSASDLTALVEDEWLDSIMPI